MRICELHRERAVETLVSKKDGTEYDLCPDCIDLMEKILIGSVGKEEKSVKKAKSGRKPTRKLVATD